MRKAFHDCLICKTMINPTLSDRDTRLHKSLGLRGVRDVSEFK